MFGVPIDGSTDIFCDNEAVYKNASTPESQLRKKHHSILYHMSREAVASGACRMAKEDTETTPMTGILIFCNRALIIWHSKRQNGVETSTFGSEFTAMKNSIKLIAALQ